MKLNQAYSSLCTQHAVQWLKIGSSYFVFMLFGKKLYPHISCVSALVEATNKSGGKFKNSLPRFLSVQAVAFVYYT